MDETIKQIGDRLKELREVLGVSSGEVAELCGMTEEAYMQMENGDGDLSVSALQKISIRYGVSLDVLLFGEESNMSSYFITRKGQAMSVEHHNSYAYRSLASGFRGRKAEPFMVAIEPRNDDETPDMTSHRGQEFNMVVEGSMEVAIGKKTFELNEGDTIYFDATQPHRMHALNNKPVRFLAIIF